MKQLQASYNMRQVGMLSVLCRIKVNNGVYMNSDSCSKCCNKCTGKRGASYNVVVFIVAPPFELHIVEVTPVSITTCECNFSLLCFHAQLFSK